MRHMDRQTTAMLSRLSPEAMLPARHSPRLIRSVTRAALKRLWRNADKFRATGGLNSIATETPLRRF